MILNEWSSFMENIVKYMKSCRFRSSHFPIYDNFQSGCNAWCYYCFGNSLYTLFSAGFYYILYVLALAYSFLQPQERGLQCAVNCVVYFIKLSLIFSLVSIWLISLCLFFYQTSLTRYFLALLFLLKWIHNGLLILLYLQYPKPLQSLPDNFNG